MSHNRRLVLLTCVLGLALVVYTNRAQLSRALIAGSIYHKHIFSPPPRLQGMSQWHQLREEAQFFWDFSEIPVARERRLKALNPTLRPIVKEISRRQTAGDDMGYPMHIYREVSWRLMWCLTHSYQPDGSFKVSDLDDTPGDAFRYGLDFLVELGYFQSKDRFWTGQQFPESKGVRDHIQTRLKSMGLNDPGLKEAFNTLQATH